MPLVFFRCSKIPLLHSHAISPAAIKLAGARASSCPAGRAAGRLLRAPKMLTAIVAAAPGTQIVLQHHKGGDPHGDLGHPERVPVSPSPRKAPSCCYRDQFGSVGEMRAFPSPFVLFLSNLRLGASSLVTAHPARNTAPRAAAPPGTWCFVPVHPSPRPQREG